jgi:hypothetical protein
VATTKKTSKASVSGEHAKALIIAEKPSVANDIAKALGGFTKHDEYFESDAFLISSAVGHLLEIAAPDEYEVKRGKWSFANLPYEIALKIGVVVGRQFRFFHDEVLEQELLRIPLFRDLVLKMFVDYSGLNKKYGTWISYVNQLPDIDEESLIFTNGVLVWKDLLNGKKLTSAHLKRIPSLSEDLHPILYGRVASLHLMLAKERKEKDKLFAAWTKIIELHPKRTLEYIFVANVKCLVFPSPEFSNFLYSCQKHASKVHFWYNLSQLNIYHLSLVQHAIFTNQRTLSRDILNKIDLSYVRYGYDEFLLLFVYLFQHELSQVPTEREELWQRLVDHAVYLNYPIFTDDYFKNYFPVL